ncbi:MAG TPA: protein-L-isoaspartate(D-aspartate) O-methyltransferase [Myxococcaceae bacterium]|nr:protein-L-isoaspartate(D-aspartate) O-methyltransferase [Myxococcaceae bacterium]
MPAVLFTLALALAGQSPAGQKRSWRPVLESAGVTDARVLHVMDKVRRADFLPPEQKAREFQDRPLPIGHEQTTSQPSLIALMIQAMRLQPGCRVLEVGTGSGYQTALLAELCREVYSIEIIAPLAERSSSVLTALGYRNARVKAGDGYLGWPERAPFDGIVVGAGAPRVPQPLVDQLAPGAKLVIPVGRGREMHLLIVTKKPDGSTNTERSFPVAFVPLTGENAERDRGRR